MRAFPILRLESLDDFSLSAQLYRTARRAGVTVSKTVDCLIAAPCVADGLIAASRGCGLRPPCDLHAVAGVSVGADKTVGFKTHVQTGRTILVPVGASAKNTVTIVIAAFALAASVALASASTAAAAPSTVAPVLFVGNNWDGTADVIRQGGTPRPADLQARGAAEHHSRHR